MSSGDQEPCLLNDYGGPVPNTIPGIQGRLSIYLLNELLQLLTTAVAIMMMIIVLSSRLRGKLLFRAPSAKVLRER